ncbi:MAG: glycosyltransferase family 39 protein [Caulobacteraceae bacterium]|nr:glycosyltransferase family 39 protein [Caulobacteraceae bacterium]
MTDADGGLAARLRQAMATPRGMALLVALLTLLTFLPGQSSIPPLDRDESRYAQATRQMIESGDYVRIRFMDTARNLQPAGIYWLQAVSVRLLGDPAVREIGPHRAPGFLAAVASVFLTWWVAALLFGPRAGRAAALMMGCAVVLTLEARFAKIDAVLCAVTLLAQAALARLYLSRAGPRPHRAWTALFWAALGAGLMLKGPIILLVSGGTVLGLVLLERRAGWLSRLEVAWGLPLALALTLPWFAAIGQATHGAFFAEALGRNALGKVAGAQEAHGGPPGYHLLAFNLMFWPGALFAWLAAPFAWRERMSDPVRFCLAWIVPAWIAFELFGTKLPHYTLPLLPAVAALAGAALQQLPERPFFGRPRLFAAAAALWLVFGLLIVVGAPAGSAWLQGGLPPLAIALAALAMAGLAATLLLAARGKAQAALFAAVAAAVVAEVNAYGLVIPSTTGMFLSPRILAAARAAAPGCPRPDLVTLKYREPSLVFAAGGHVRFARKPGEAARLLAAAPRCGVAAVETRKEAAFDAAARSLGFEPRLTTRVTGFNYSEGRRESLAIYRVSAAPGTGPSPAGPSARR